MRINRFLASCSVGSRRSVEQLIRNGKIKVNGEKLTELSYNVLPTDIVSFNGKRLTIPQKKIYIALNKPSNYIVSQKDEFNRKIVGDLLPSVDMRLFPIGRLDKDSKGLILFTNDGDFANGILHPKQKVEKTYKVKIDGIITKPQLDILRGGVVLDGVKSNTCKIFIKAKKDGKTTLKVVLQEGKNRQIRRMFKKVGFDVISLKRQQIGFIKLGKLPLGRWRFLTNGEIKRMKTIS